jgi:signal transduction histidine kinase
VGLALSRGLTERMDGTMAVRSTPGEGSAFTVSLPDATPSEAPAAATHHTTPA